MRFRTYIALGIAMGLMSYPMATASGQDSRPGIAVWAFENGGSYGQDAEVFDALQVGMQQMLMTELAQNSALRVVDRAEINALMQEQDLGASGRVDANTAARVGKLVGARYMVLGGFIDFYGDFRIDARIVNVETGEIVNTARVRDKREELYKLVIDLATDVTEGVNLPALPSQVREARENRDLPAEALTLYSRALFFQDRGMNDRAIQLFRRVQSEFPDMVEETSEALKQLGQS